MQSTWLSVFFVSQIVGLVGSTTVLTPERDDDFEEWLRILNLNASDEVNRPAIQYPAALGAIIVSVLLPGLVIFTLIFIACFFCCYWRKIPFLRRQFSKSTQGRAKPKKVPASAYPHQQMVQYTPGQPGDNPDSGKIQPLQSEVRIHVEPATETDNKDEEPSGDSNYASQEAEDADSKEKQPEPDSKEPEPDSKEPEPDSVLLNQ
ncbi:uncharacterized protein [Amphiura filiformis]|uniref:uncharacterized protein n=1 Tax=Amphiura filiformis TaxID=82378 RepID=UPI003B2202F5